jgi:hypothetical protein
MQDAKRHSFTSKKRTRYKFFLPAARRLAHSHERRTIDPEADEHSVTYIGEKERRNCWQGGKNFASKSGVVSWSKVELGRGKTESGKLFSGANSPQPQSTSIGLVGTCYKTCFSIDDEVKGNHALAYEQRAQAGCGRR